MNKLPCMTQYRLTERNPKCWTLCFLSFYPFKYLILASGFICFILSITFSIFPFIDRFIPLIGLSSSVFFFILFIFQFIVEDEEEHHTDHEQDRHLPRCSLIMKTSLVWFFPLFFCNNFILVFYLFTNLYLIIFVQNHPTIHLQ